MTRRLSNIIFATLLFVLAYFYNYHEIVKKRPQSVHAWRQSDCASIALNYSQNGMHFFKPEVHNLTSDQGESGYAATSEIPFLYYTVALLYKFLGFHEWIYRLLNTLIFLLGIYYLFRSFNLMSHDFFWSIALPLSILSSPLLIYYGNNFLSDSTAFSFTLIAWYHFLKYKRNAPKIYLVYSLLFFFLAGALKVTALLSFIALSIVFLLEITHLIYFRTEKKIFRSGVLFGFSSLAIILLIGSWIFYAHKYNQLHDCTYFSTTTFPIWSLDSEGIKAVFHNIRFVWLDEYFSRSFLIFLAFLSLFILAHLKSAERFLMFILGLSFLGGLLFFVLQFWTFKDHDYYLINIYIIPVFILFTAFNLALKKYPKLMASIVFKTLFAVFIIYNYYYAGQKLNQRYHGYMNAGYEKLKDVFDSKAFLNQIGILPGDTIIFLPSQNHIPLYLMNLKGWTNYHDARFNREKPVIYNADSIGIVKSVNNGAKYLFINGPDELINNKYIQSFTRQMIGRHNNLLVFDLHDTTLNFSIAEIKTKADYFCDMETISGSGEFFTGQNNRGLFGNVETRSQDKSFSGEFSLKLNKERPYGATILIDSVRYDEKIKISVWKKANDPKIGTIISSSENPAIFYHQSVIQTDSASNGWTAITKEFRVPEELDHKSLKIYLYNENEESVYFDDLRIEFYRTQLEF
jgi:hypothetical protein